MFPRTTSYRQFFCSVVFCLTWCLFLSSTALAQGEPGSPECGAAQVDAQFAVLEGAPYRNHGQMTSVAAQVIDAYESLGDITEECSSCVVSQFARRIPVGDQEACGVPCPCFATAGDIINIHEQYTPGTLGPSFPGSCTTTNGLNTTYFVTKNTSGVYPIVDGDGICSGRQSTIADIQQAVDTPACSTATSLDDFDIDPETNDVTVDTDCQGLSTYSTRVSHISADALESCRSLIFVAEALMPECP